MPHDYLENLCLCVSVWQNDVYDLETDRQLPGWTDKFVCLNWQWLFNCDSSVEIDELFVETDEVYSNCEMSIRTDTISSNKIVCSNSTIFF